MTSVLFVCLNTDPVGAVTLDAKRQWIFQYHPQWIGSDDAFPLSVRLPLQQGPFAPDVAKPFFVNLLPEANVRKLIAGKFGISVANDFALLGAIGGDCAGAISVHSEENRPSSEGNYRGISKLELADLIDAMPRHPLLTANGRARLSLAGAQEKLPVYYDDGKVYLPENGAASSHILKPSIPEFRHSAHNELFCMQLAHAAGLPVPYTEMLFCRQHAVCMVARYDRVGGGAVPVRRLHQEDFCQALGMYPEQKYQNEGGPSFADCAGAIATFTAQPAVDKKSLIAWAIFNTLVGNCDAHAKNVALLIAPRQVCLAPFYDLLCTAVYEGLSDKLAMKIGGQYERAMIFKRHWERFAEEIGVKSRIVLQMLTDFAERLPDLARERRNAFVAECGAGATVDAIIHNLRSAAKKILAPQ